jgi:hypothetical protein
MAAYPVRTNEVSCADFTRRGERRIKGGERTIGIHKRRVLGRAIIRPRELQEPAERVDLVFALEDRLVVHGGVHGDAVRPVVVARREPGLGRGLERAAVGILRHVARLVVDDGFDERGEGGVDGQEGGVVRELVGGVAEPLGCYVLINNKRRVSV